MSGERENHQKGQSGRADPKWGDKKTQKAVNDIFLKNRFLNKEDYTGEDGKIALTPQEEEFAQYAAAGYNFEAAGRMAYGYEDDPREWSPGRGASIARRPRVSLRIQELVEQRIIEQVGEADRLRKFITARLEYEAIEAPESASRIKAVELLGKKADVAYFSEQINHTGLTDTSTPEEIHAVLMKRLESVMKKLPPKAVDVNEIEIPAPSAKGLNSPAAPKSKD